jgi:peptidyl-prolyl cis-trans isomerase C
MKRFCMKKMIKSVVLLCAVAPLVALGASAPPAGLTNVPATPPSAKGDVLATNTVIAKGKGVSVTRGQLDDEVVRIRANAAVQGRLLPPDLEQQVLDGLITRQLLLTKTTEADKVKGKEQFLAALQKIKTTQKMTDEEFNQKLVQQLRLLSMTRDEWEKQSMEQATIPIVLERDLKITVTSDQIKKFYDENPARFEQPEMARAAHILIGTRDQTAGTPMSDEAKAAKKKQIDDLLKRARAGEDFAKLAKEFSDDPGSKDRGGELNPFPRGAMMPEFEAAAFSLNTNQISDVVTTPYGFHIIKLYEKMPAKKLPLDQVAPDIKEFLLQREISTLLPDYVQKLKKDAGVQILDERLKAAEAAKSAGASSSPASPAAPVKK